MPEHRLWKTVIANTVQEWLSGRLRASREAEHYLLQDKKDFPTVCYAAGLDPSALRLRLFRLKKQGSRPAKSTLAHA